MYRGSRLIAIVPARGGSKGVPNKNILECAGKPLIEWTISAAKSVDFIDEVLVSTDSEEIAAVSRQAGATVPFLRPGELATDDASLLEAIRHAWENHPTAADARYDYVVVLQPTSPLRTGAHIVSAIKHYFENRKSDEDTLASVCQVNPKFGWLMQYAEGGEYIRFCLDINVKNPQRQELKRYFLPNGAIFIVKGTALADGLYRKNTLPFVMPARDSIDIDTIDEFSAAEKNLRILQQPEELQLFPERQE